MYAANIGFAIALNINAGLWLPPVMAVVLGLVPAALAFRPQRPQSTPPTTKNANPVVRRISQMVVQKGSWMLARRDVKIQVEGMEYVPHSGPVLIVARHFHHLYDGCVLLKTIPRPLHILVALDWVQKRWLRRVMELACTLASWPMLLRVEQFNTGSNTQNEVGQGAYSRRRGQKISAACHQRLGATAAQRRGTCRLSRSVSQISTRHPHRKKMIEAFLPFRQGFARIAEMAERDGHTHVAIIPAGFTYVHNNNGILRCALVRRSFAMITAVQRNLCRPSSNGSDPLRSNCQLHARSY